MFREGQYLEVIKISDNCLATAIVTVKEKMVLIDNKKILTNKWLNLEDWSELYKILQRAILRNSKISKEKSKYKSSERKKSTKRLDVVYQFESLEDGSLPTIKVRVSPAKKKLQSTISIEKKIEKENNELLPPIFSNDSPEMKLQRLMEGIESSPEEYVPPELPNKSSASDLKYIPSRKCFLKRSHQSSDEYTPTSESNSKITETEMTYIPNPISKLNNKRKYDTYEPGGISSLSPSLTEAYIPSSKNSKQKISEEYQPGFPSTTMKFDNSYVPSSKINIEKNDKKDKVRKKNHKKSLNSTKKTVNLSKKEL